MMTVIKLLKMNRDTACPNEGFLAQLTDFEGVAAAAVGKQLREMRLPGADALLAADLAAIAESLQAAEAAAKECKNTKFLPMLVIYGAISTG